MAKVFFSYASEDKAVVNEFREAFKQQDVPVWIDNEQIQYGESIPGGINAALSECSGAVLFFSPRYVKKPWTTEERNALIYQMLEKSEFKLVVEQLEPCEIPPILKHRLWHGQGSPSKLAKSFCQWLGNVTIPDTDTEVPDFMNAIDDRAVEQLATAIAKWRPDCGQITFHTKQLGALTVELVSPLSEFLHDEVRFQLRMIGTHEFFRREFQAKLAEAGLGIFEPGFKHQLQARMLALEESRQQLRDAVDAIVVRAVKAPI